MIESSTEVFFLLQCALFWVSKTSVIVVLWTAILYLPCFVGSPATKHCEKSFLDNVLISEKRLQDCWAINTIFGIKRQNFRLHILTRLTGVNACSRRRTSVPHAPDLSTSRRARRPTCRRPSQPLDPSPSPSMPDISHSRLVISGSKLGSELCYGITWPELVTLVRTPRVSLAFWVVSTAPLIVKEI